MKQHDLLIINDNHFMLDHNKAYFRGSTFHYFVKGFYCYFNNVRLSSPSLDYEKVLNRELAIDGVFVLPRLGYGKARNYYKTVLINFLTYFKHLKSHAKNFDYILLVAPACTLPISYFVAKLLRKKIALYVVGDVIEIVKNHQEKKVISLLGAKFEWGITKHIARKNLTFVLGDDLYNKLSPVAKKTYPAMTSLIDANDIVINNKTFGRPIRLLSVSRLSVEKGLEYSLNAFRQLIEKYDIQYTIVGDGPELNKLKGLAEKLAIMDKAIFVGYQEHHTLDKYYKNADVFVIPSLSEGIPKAILEAMSYGLSIIASNVGGVPFLVGYNGERGWLVEPGNTPQIYKAIEDCINNKNARAQKKDEATKFVRFHTLQAEAKNISEKMLAD